ncbi:hypothetical protein TNCV_1620611 [Trichonephila clavipes]|nr:hypothetical protein TNCV_1620611 [Trichonephila clavipes]
MVYENSIESDEDIADRLSVVAGNVHDMPTLMYVKSYTTAVNLVSLLMVALSSTYDKFVLLTQTLHLVSVELERAYKIVLLQ